MLRCFYTGSDMSQRCISQRFIFCEDAFVLCFGIIIHFFDRRSRQNIVELVTQDDLPALMQLFFRICTACGLCIQHCVHFFVLICKFCFPVELFVSCHRSISTSVVFQIQLAYPGRQIFFSGYMFVQHMEEFFCSRHLGSRHTRETFCQTSLVLQHIFGWTAATISEAEAAKYFFVQIFLAVSCPCTLHLARIDISVISGKVFCLCTTLYCCLIIVTGRNKMCQYTASVDTFPFECIIWHLVKLVPADLCCHEIRNSTFLQDLRKCCGITEYVRKPQDLIVHAELFFEESLSVYKLANQCFTGSDVTVCLYEHTTVRLPASFFDSFFDLFIHIRSIFLHIFVQLRLAGHKYIFRILFHQFQYGRKASYCFIFCHTQGPQPCTVDMGVSHAVDNRALLAVTVFFIKFFCDIFLSFLQAFIILFGTFFSHIQQVQRFVHCLNDRDICLIFRVQQSRTLVRNFQVIVIFFCFTIQYFQAGIHLQTEVLISGKCRQDDAIGISCFGRFCQDDLSVVDIKTLYSHTVYKDGKLRIRCIPFSFFSGFQFVHYALSVKFFRNRHYGLKPVIFSVSTPQFLVRNFCPGCGIQIVYIQTSLIGADHLVTRNRNLLWIYLFLQIFQHFTDSFF